MIFGPYGWTGGTWHVLVETAAHHIVRVIEETRRRGATAVEVKHEAAERWTRFITERLSRSRCGHCRFVRQRGHSYYFDHHGDTPFLRTDELQAGMAGRAGGFPLDDYVYDTVDADSARAPRPEASRSRAA